MAYLENSGGYASMVWVNYRHGREFACHADDIIDIGNIDEMPEDLRKKYLDASNLTETERW